MCVCARLSVRLRLVWGVHVCARACIRLYLRVYVCVCRFANVRACGPVFIWRGVCVCMRVSTCTVTSALCVVELDETFNTISL